MSTARMKASGFRLLGAAYRDPESLRANPPDEASLVGDQVEALRGLLRKASMDSMVAAGASHATVQQVLRHASEGDGYDATFAEHMALWSGDSSTSVPPVVHDLNGDWFVLDESGQLFVCRFVEDHFPHKQARKRLVRYRFDAFRQKHNTLVNDGAKRVSLGTAWLNWPGRRQYDRAVFDPSGGLLPPDVLNLWTGWAVTPKPGDWSLIRRHIEEVVCSGVAEYSDYLIRWIANFFQHPEEPAGVVVVLRGKEGAGKSVLGVAIRRASGQHGLMVSNSKHVVGNFNAHLRDLIFLECGEAFFAGDRAHANQLKALVTDDMLTIEAKGVDSVAVPNRLHILMTTNERWAVSAGPESRRYFVLDVSGDRRGDEAYMSKLWAQVNDDDAIAAMVHELLSLDLTGFSVRKFPVTEGLLAERARSANGILGWALDLADRGELTARNGTTSAWREFVLTRDLYDDYQEWVGRNRFESAMPADSFGRALTHDLGLQGKECPAAFAASVRPLDRRKKGYVLGTLEEFTAKARTACGLPAHDSISDPSEDASVPPAHSVACSDGSEAPKPVPTSSPSAPEGLTDQNTSLPLGTIGSIGTTVCTEERAPTALVSPVPTLDDALVDALDLVAADPRGFPDKDVGDKLRLLLADLEGRGLVELEDGRWRLARSGSDS